VRIVPALPMTDSFKPRKVELQRQGVDPRRVQGALYAYDEQAGAYTELEAAGWAEALARL
jgi:fatty-acyl-CoA synthase